MTRKAQRRKGLPPVPRNADPETRQFLDALKEQAEVNQGTRGDALDQGLTFRDLVDMGIAKFKRRLGGRVSLDDLEAANPANNRSTPPRPTNVQGSSVIGATVLVWSSPFQQYGNHGYTEILRAEGENALPGAAQRVGVANGSMFTDYTVEPGKYRYWIRFISQADVRGPLHSSEGLLINSLRSSQDILQRLAQDFADTDPSAGVLTEDFIIDARRFAIRTGHENEVRIPFAVVTEDGQQIVVMQNIRVDEGVLGPISFGKITDENGDPITTVSGLLKAEMIDAENLQVDWANIVNADITTADIRDAAVETLKIAENAVIVPTYDINSDSINLWGQMSLENTVGDTDFYRTPTLDVASVTVNPQGGAVQINLNFGLYMRHMGNNWKSSWLDVSLRRYPQSGSSTLIPIPDDWFTIMQLPTRALRRFFNFNIVDDALINETVTYVMQIRGTSRFEAGGNVGISNHFTVRYASIFLNSVKR